MLVVDSVVPGSPADGVLEPGDVLVRVGGQVVSHFLVLEEELDAAVGGSVELVFERGGEPIGRGWGALGGVVGLGGKGAVENGGAQGGVELICLFVRVFKF